MLDLHLTEIKNAHLFMEYLMTSGVTLPSSRNDNWELSNKEQVIARIKKDSDGVARFFICAAEVGCK
ncbi:hypothetical protein [uncultured Tolumonas sp.]|uniref:hypothetical protein n=1 Tax=uncultured Tolumonas sp. TaxID=263765 RepID=UPI002A0A146A|nr:hypothetical protein [uncultured Tolumonas sp.]